MSDTDYKDLYLEEKFGNINSKLDDLKEMLGCKASAGSVLRLESRVSKVEADHDPCKLLMGVKLQVDDIDKRLKPIEEVTEDVLYYKKHPKQFKMMVIGFVILVVLNLAVFIPTIYAATKSVKELTMIEAERQNQQNK